MVAEVVLVVAAVAGCGSGGGDSCGGGSGGGERNITLGLELIKCLPKLDVILLTSEKMSKRFFLSFVF